MIIPSTLTKENVREGPVLISRELCDPPSPKFILRDLREERRLSQRDLAKRLGIQRSYLQRLECKPLDEISFGELKLLARGFEMKMEELIHRFQIAQKGEEFLCRSNLKNPFSLSEVAKGIQFASYLKRRGICSVGALILQPRTGLSKDETPNAEFLFCLVMEGNLLLNLFCKDYFFKEEECFSLDGHLLYELYNPHQFRRLTALLFTFPDSSYLI